MDIMTMVATALTNGAIAGGKGVATELVKDCYSGLKKLIQERFGKAGGVETALEQVEQDTDSAIWKAALEEGVKKAGLAEDSEILSKAKELLTLLEQAGIDTGSTIVTVNGSGAIALGEKSVAAGAGGTAIGTVKGDVHLGSFSGKG